MTAYMTAAAAPVCRVDCSCGASLWGGVPQVNALVADRHRSHRIVAAATLTTAQLVDEVAAEVCDG